MKAHLFNAHLLVPRSRSSAKVIKYKGYISQKMAVSGPFVFHKHILFVMFLRLCNVLYLRNNIFPAPLMLYINIFLLAV